MLVIDASAIVPAAITGGEFLPADKTWHAPAGLDLEFASALRRLTLAGIVSASDGREALDRFMAMNIDRHETARLLPRIWALRHDISSYDAAYVALAESLGVPLLTRDRRLARTAQRYCTVVAP